MPFYQGHISTVSNREDWSETFEILDEDTGTPINITGASVTMSVIKPWRNPNAYASGYFYDYPPGPTWLGALLTGSTATGELVLVDPVNGVVQWLFPAARMNNLPQGEYQVGIKLNQGGAIMQAMIGVVGVFEGIDLQ